MKSIIIMMVTFLILSTSIAYALVFGGSNLGVFGYPEHSCSKPYGKPYKPFQFNSQYEIDTYNSEVESYNQKLSDYLDCIRDYVDNAKNDIERVKEAANDAINEANTL